VLDLKEAITTTSHPGTNQRRRGFRCGIMWRWYGWYEKERGKERGSIKRGGWRPTAEH